MSESEDDVQFAEVDVRDEAVRLVERIAEKCVEPFSEGNDDKTIGCWRHELNALLHEAVEYENRRRARASANLSRITSAECGDMGRA